MTKRAAVPKLDQNGRCCSTIAALASMECDSVAVSAVAGLFDIDGIQCLSSSSGNEPSRVREMSGLPQR